MVRGTHQQQRRSIRLPGADYSVPGFYFVTICTKNREEVFGEVVKGEMILNVMGKIVEEEWLKTPIIRENIGVDEFVVMPNHFHGVIEIIEAASDLACRGVLQYAPTPIGQFGSPTQSIGAIVRGFKGAVTSRINKSRQTPGALVWQRNYYEHIIRNDISFNRIRQYIRDNPINWETDLENNRVAGLLDEQAHKKRTAAHYARLFG